MRSRLSGNGQGDLLLQRRRTHAPQRDQAVGQQRHQLRLSRHVRLGEHRTQMRTRRVVTDIELGFDVLQAKAFGEPYCQIGLRCRKGKQLLQEFLVRVADYFLDPQEDQGRCFGLARND